MAKEKEDKVAAEKDPQELCEKGIAASKRGNDDEAFRCFSKAAEQGHVKAQYLLGMHYGNGQGVPKDKEKAFYWYTKAAEQGYAEAQGVLGFCYYYGNSVPKDYAKAAEWYTKAAEQGNAKAQKSLGVCYEYGAGVPKDKAKAAYWNESGKKAEADRIMASISEKAKEPREKGGFVSPLAKTAEKLYEKGFDAYVRGDYKKAFKCYSKAALLGNDNAQSAKINMLREGLAH